MAAVAVTPYDAKRPPAGALSAGAWGAALNAPTDHWELRNNDGRTLIALRNAHGSQVLAVTVESDVTVDGLAVADPVYTVAANTDAQFIGPWPVDVYGATVKLTATNQGTGHIQAVRF